MSRVSRWGDRLNPVLVKELRQSVRGKQFRSLFIMALLVAAVLSAGFLSSLDADLMDAAMKRSGPRFFLRLFTVFAFCALVVVPVQAHRSMVAERDEQTFDALVISGLRPAQIVFGKWAAATSMLGLFLVAMLPFLAVSTTLYGLDFLTAALLLVFTLLAGLALSLLGVIVACLGYTKATHSLLLMVLLAGCGFSLMLLLQLSHGLLGGFGGGFGSTREFLVAMATLISGTAVGLTWLHGLAVATLSHPEENGMLRVRMASLVCTLYLTAAVILLTISVPGATVRNGIQLMTGAAALIGILNVPTLTESSGMRVRCRFEILGGKWRRPGSWLFFPGGGSAFVLLLLQLGVLSSALLFFSMQARPFHPGTMQPIGLLDYLMQNGLGAYLTMLGVVLACAGAPGALATHPRTPVWLRHALRLLIPTLPIWLIAIAGILSLLLDLDSRLLQSALNPAWVMDRNFPRAERLDAVSFWLAVGGASAIVMLASALRLRAQIREVRGLATPQAPAAEEDAAA